MTRECTIEAMVSWENLLLAARRARRGKSRRAEVEEFFHRLESRLGNIREELRAGTWSPGGYRTFEIREPKRRMISAAPFADRVVHHALSQVIRPVLERSFIARSYSCQKGKGTMAARECVRKLVNRHRCVLKCDIRKFYQSIDHEILFAQLCGRVRCAGIRQVIARILASHRTGPELAAACFPGDAPEEADRRPRGLPIGNLTSQLWGNFHLDRMDHWICEELGYGAYARYTDDFLVFGDSKAGLLDLRREVAGHLAGLRLGFAEPKSRLLACREGVPFCGMRFLPGRRPRVLGATKRRFERRVRVMQKHPDPARLTVAVRAWYAFAEEAETTGLKRRYAAGNHKKVGPALVRPPEEVPKAPGRHGGG